MTARENGNIIALNCELTNIRTVLSFIKYGMKLVLRIKVCFNLSYQNEIPVIVHVSLR
jgi:hypothetical protein